jgi:hypothetical protein
MFQTFRVYIEALQSAVKFPLLWFAFYTRVFIRLVHCKVVLLAYTRYILRMHVCIGIARLFHLHIHAVYTQIGLVSVVKKNRDIYLEWCPLQGCFTCIYTVCTQNMCIGIARMFYLYTVYTQIELVSVPWC